VSVAVRYRTATDQVAPSWLYLRDYTYRDARSTEHKDVEIKARQSVGKCRKQGDGKWTIASTPQSKEA